MMVQAVQDKLQDRCAALPCLCTLLPCEAPSSSAQCQRHGIAGQVRHRYFLIWRSSP